MPGYCVTCMPLGKQCPTNYLMPFNPNWSDSEREGEEWNGDKQKEKELKELELKTSNIIDPKAHNTSPCPQLILMKQCLPHNVLILLVPSKTEITERRQHAKQFWR